MRGDNMMKKLLLVFILIYSISFLVLAQDTQEEQGLEQKLSAFIVSTVIDKDGNEVEVFAPATTAKSGQIIEYRYHAKNTSEGDINNFVPIIPIPSVTTFLSGSATESDLFVLEYSVDGGKSFAVAPLMKKVTNDQGEEIEVEVDPSEYQAVRWTMLESFKVNQEIDLKFRVSVN